jgi:protein-S-isoprenylcysteine O-methyltransferase Ste14
MQRFKRDVLRGHLTRSIILTLIIFLPAGTLNYWQAWVFVIIFTSCNSAIMAYLWRNDRQLLEQRIQAGPRAEKERVQKIIMLLLSYVLKMLVVTSVIDHRLQIQRVPVQATIGGDLLVAIGFYIIFIVFRVNTFASATVETTGSHVVISTGPYAIVRHPMYVGSLAILSGIPLALGSYWGLLMTLAAVQLFIWRIIEEERFLEEKLHDYTKYQTATRWRLMPLIF